ncbi:MAG: hypothetical protein JWO63_3082 [Frankiales bacterium]|nr:hypothetical protein [Frankiales bacterium]
MTRHAKPISRGRRALSLALAATTLGLFATAGALWASNSGPATATAAAVVSASQTKTVTRANLVDGQDDVVDSRQVTVNVSSTQSLRDRQAIEVSWSGAHPTGGVIFDDTSQYAANQEYPMVLMECRGSTSTTAPAAQQISPETCFTQTPEERYQPRSFGAFPPYRVDRYASVADRALVVGAPAKIPDTCEELDVGAERWVPFVAASGTAYYGGQNGCAGLAPEQSTVENSLAPPNTTFATTDLAGNGSTKFVVNTADTNASLGCSDTVPCALVAIPIMGISCDAQGTAEVTPGAALPPADVPTDQTKTFSKCSQTGAYPAGVPGTQGSAGTTAQLSVTGQLWWSASNWRNRIAIPLTFAQSASVCGVVSKAKALSFFGSESLLEATQQWAPAFCLNPKLFPIAHVQQSEVAAKNLLQAGLTNVSTNPKKEVWQYTGPEAVFQGEPPATPFTNPIVQAPTAVSGFAISYVMDDAKGNEYTSLKLNARLLAKLLTMSYPAYPDVKSGWKTYSVTTNKVTTQPYAALANNPLDLAVDPEFLALNPGMTNQNINQLESSATLYAMSGDSDVMTALTSYINSDPDARAWLDGKPDPWGMVVNPNYRGIALPVSQWPQLDTYYDSLNSNECMADNQAPILPLIAAPVSDPSIIPFNVQYGIANSQVVCTYANDLDNAANRQLVALGREDPGIRFILGVTSIADADRYQLNTAALQTQRPAGPDATFSDLAGRTYVAPTDDSLKAAAQLLTPDTELGTWTLPYDKIRTDPDDALAYPGTMLLSTDIATQYLSASDAAQYAQFLNFVAGTGQVSGLANGNLAAGYLPLTAANGLTQLVNYTKAAALAVAAQQGHVPALTGDPPAPTATDAASGPTAAGDGSPTTPGDSSTNPAAIAGGPGDDASSPAASATAAPTKAGSGSTAPPTSTIDAIPAGKTTSAESPLLGYALPGLLALGLLTGLGSAAVVGVGRR